MTLFNDRLFLVPAEDPNLLWFSKQVIQHTPVEMSDLLTIYVAPTTSTQENTGPTKAVAPLDDKIILFKRDSIYYINGNGPDNTGANNQYGAAVFVTSTVGCENQRSIVLIPQGLMFQSNKGIWLLGRDLSTSYIGAPVEAFNDATVLSAINIPGTNQVRFTLSTGQVLMYDYFYQQWGEFTGIPAISSTRYADLHTYIDSYGRVFQESPDSFLDGSIPVLMSFKTGWFNFAGIQGYERFYFMHLLGTYITPFKLNVQLGYDYNSSPSQSIIVTPDNFSGAYGSGVYGGSSPYGGPGRVFEARVFPQKQKCESFQITVQELFDSTQGVPAGAGFNLSGLNLTVGLKKAYRTSKASRSFG